MLPAQKTLIWLLAAVALVSAQYDVSGKSFDFFDVPDSTESLQILIACQCPEELSPHSLMAC